MEKIRKYRKIRNSEVQAFINILISLIVLCSVLLHIEVIAIQYNLSFKMQWDQMKNLD